MSTKKPISDDELSLFRETVKGIRPLRQDTIRPRIKGSKQKKVRLEQAGLEDQQAYFSDTFEPLLESEGPTRYVRRDVSRYELKKLRRGDYQPELLLDLHGLDQRQAKLELAALLDACRRQHCRCASVMHGFGRHILKRKVPLWLAQHPHVMAFHQAPKIWGGQAALLILIELQD
jgi:DNA-nicking Smr family endonuclease